VELVDWHIRESDYLPAILRERKKQFLDLSDDVKAIPDSISF